MTRRNIALRDYLRARAGLVPELATAADKPGPVITRAADYNQLPNSLPPEPVTLICPDCGKEVETKLVRHFTRIGKSTDTGMHQELLPHGCKG